MPVNEGPIPGENYTSDTKNYPWHQPPEFTSLSKALDYTSKRMTDKKVIVGLVAAMEMGIPLVNVSQMILMQGVSEGKWTVDFALLMAGPTVKILEIIADFFEVEIVLGIEEEEKYTTGYFFKNQADLKKNKDNGKLIKTIQEELPEIKEEAESQPDEGAPEGDIQVKGAEVMTSGADPMMAPTPTEEAPPEESGGFAAPPVEEEVM